MVAIRPTQNLSSIKDLYKSTLENIGLIITMEKATTPVDRYGSTYTYDNSNRSCMIFMNDDWHCSFGLYMNGGR